MGQTRSCGTLTLALQEVVQHGRWEGRQRLAGGSGRAGAEVRASFRPYF